MIVYVIGVTCAGKSFFLDKYRDDPNVGLVEVGKEFRKRYPPGHFEGKGAMEKTEKEALQIYDEMVEANRDKNVILVDGQPRQVSQVKTVVNRYLRPEIVLWLHASDNMIEKRIALRDPASQELARQRSVNDRVQLYDTLYYLYKTGITIHVTDSNANLWEYV